MRLRELELPPGRFVAWAPGRARRAGEGVQAELLLFGPRGLEGSLWLELLPGPRLGDCRWLPLRPRAASRREFLVRPGGSDEHGGLLAALAVAPTGSRIRLAPGTYLLDRPLRLERGVELVGEGPDRVQLGGMVPGALVVVRSLELCRLEGLSLERFGDAAGDVLACPGGRVELRGCVLAGARADWTGLGGAGARVTRRGSLRASQCSFERHALGAVVVDRGRAELEEVAIERSTRGLLLRDAEAELRACRLEALNTGIYADRGTRVELREAEFRHLERGVVAEEDARVEIRASRFRELRRSAVEALSYARVRLVSNRVHAVEGTGIFASERARLEATGNTCQFCASGIALLGHASGRVQGNTCRRDDVGLKLGSDGGVLVEGNRLVENRSIGIWLREGARGHVVGNVCERNGRGLLVEPGSRALLADNELRGDRGFPRPAGRPRRRAEPPPEPLGSIETRSLDG